MEEKHILELTSNQLEFLIAVCRGVSFTGNYDQLAPQLNRVNEMLGLLFSVRNNGGTTPDQKN